MTDPTPATWSSPVELPLGERLVSAELQLVLADRVIGLEA
ncbi:MAG: hypothetical protein JWO10_441, partial [Microbacteriaceae bacterium]|nr:hypothetical protein [Microbacteriaceae bacterium]